MLWGSHRQCDSRHPSYGTSSRLLTFVTFGSAVLLAMCPVAAEAQLRQVTLTGRVRTDQGIPVKSASVQLQTEDGEKVAEVPTNTAGEFYLPQVSKRNYILMIKAEGFEPYQERMDLGEGADTVIVNVTLTPLGRAPQEKGPPPALTDAQAPKEAKHEYEKAVKALQSHKLGEARKHLENAVSDYPCYARAQTDLGVVLSQDRDYKGSEAALRKSITCDAGYLDSYSALGALLNAEKRYDEALYVVEAGARQAPGSWQFYYQMGIAQYGLRHYEAAEQQFNTAASLTPDPPVELKVKLADVYLKESEFPKAYAAMEDYLKAEPDGRLAPRIKEIMKQMQSSGVLESQPTAPSFGPQPH
jgi:tetratricopeptide (TPR) repeat protein